MLSSSSSARGILLRIARETRLARLRWIADFKKRIQQRTGENSALKSLVRYNNKTKSCRVCPPLAPKAGSIKPLK